MGKISLRVRSTTFFMGKNGFAIEPVRGILKFDAVRGLHTFSVFIRFFEKTLWVREVRLHHVQDWSGSYLH